MKKEMTSQMDPSLGVPPSSRHTCSVLVEKVAPDELLANRQFDYEIRLTNLSPLTIESIVIAESVVSLISISECSPPSQVEKEHTARWTIGPLYPNSTVHIRLRCLAREGMRFRSRTTVEYAH